MFHSYYEKIPNVHKIAVVRANALGNFIFALSALQARREAYPQAEIVFLGRAMTVIRGLFAPFGHGVWTCILGAVGFRESAAHHVRSSGLLILTYSSSPFCMVPGMGCH